MDDNTYKNPQATDFPYYDTYDEGFFLPIKPREAGSILCSQ